MSVKIQLDGADYFRFGNFIRSSNQLLWASINFCAFYISTADILHFYLLIIYDNKYILLLHISTELQIDKDLLEI